MLYGTTYQGGANGYGTVFQLSTDGTVFNVLQAFDYTNGAYPYTGELLQGSDGMLYGTTYQGGANGYGTVFQLSTDGTTFTILHSFDPSTEGYHPYSGLVQGSDGLLYGTTYYGISGEPRNIGTLYSIDTAGSSFTTLFVFGDGTVDGRHPGYGTLAMDKQGNFYGTTYQGGMFDVGTLFKITPAGQVTILHHFAAGKEGAYPYSSVAIASNGNLYGTTYNGGIYNSGTVYEFSQTTGTLKTLYHFGQAGGANVAGGLVLVGTTLYGTTWEGGQSNKGTVFKIKLPTPTKALSFQLMHSFTGSNGEGANPFDKLLLSADKKYLYGTTHTGGTHGVGTVFKISATDGSLTTLHAFDYSTDGGYPYAGLILGSNGMLYGTTYEGGPTGYGTAFRINTDGTGFTVLHAFDYTDGAYPYAGLLLARDGQLYGTTTNGGINNTGIVFKLSPDGSSFTTIHTFGPSDNTDGTNPHGGLIEGLDGNLYGTTYNGGIASTSFVGTWGTVFKLGTMLPSLKSFSPNIGSVALHTKVTINGMNLSGATVTIGGVVQTIVSNTSAKVIITLASGTPMGQHPIQVTTANGPATSSKLITINP
jgi:uncharacterized repeat protein (TIGR03803 family)